MTAPETLPGAYWDSVLHQKARRNITDYGKHPGGGGGGHSFIEGGR